MGVTLDGFVHGAKGYEDWGLPPEDDEVVAWRVASLREAGAHIMGRATYEAMASVWPNTTGVYAGGHGSRPQPEHEPPLSGRRPGCQRSARPAPERVGLCAAALPGIG
jgi:dihydrofolate reductase